MYNGNKKIKNMYVHTDDVYRCYLGGDLVFANYEIMYMTFEIISGGTITWRHNRTLTGDVGNLTIEYRINNGEWQSITSSTGGTSFNVNAGDRVLFRSTNSRLGSLPLSYNTFGDSTAVFEVYGNLFSMIYGDNFRGQTTVENQYEFNRLFAGAKITSAENLIIPATTVAMHCFTSMFEGCTLMTKAPSLLATTLENSCCNEMFKDCSSLSYMRCLAGDISAYNCTYNWVNGVAASGTFVKNANMSDWSTGNSGIPNGWAVINEDAPVPPGPDYKSMPLTFNIISGGTISWRATSASYTKEIQYSINDGEWTSITSTTAGTLISLNDGDIIQFKGDGAITTSSSNPNRFRDGTIVFEVYGNIMSLIDSTGYVTATTAADHSFRQLFQLQTGLTSAENLVLPATTIGTNVYKEMFRGCSSLTTAPELPATTLAQSCYMGMFNGCTSLTTAPELPASTLAQECYRQMFSGCTSLVTAPELPATTLADYCYGNMFDGCTSLTTAPSILPATTLAYRCYYQMFQNCTALTTAPELPATTLANACYYYMFYGCTSLNYIKCLATDISASQCTTNWVNGVQTNSGTFVKNANMSSWTEGVDGIPSGWTVEDA